MLSLVTLPAKELTTTLSGREQKLFSKSPSFHLCGVLVQNRAWAEPNAVLYPGFPPHQGHIYLISLVF